MLNSSLSRGGGQVQSSVLSSLERFKFTTTAMEFCLWRRVAVFLLLYTSCLLQFTASDVRTIVLTTFPSYSHCREVAAIGKELRARGHNVIFFMPDFFDMSKCMDVIPPKLDMTLLDKDVADLMSVSAKEQDTPDIKSSQSKTKATDISGSFVPSYISLATFKVDKETTAILDEQRNRIKERSLAKEKSTVETLFSTEEIISQRCKVYLSDAMLKELDRLNKAVHIDFMILDGLPIALCLPLLAAYLRVPFAMVSSHIDHFSSKQPLPIAYYPPLITSFPGRMTFVQRLINCGLIMLQRCMSFLINVIAAPGISLGEEFVGADFSEYAEKADLFLENSDYIADYPKALFPNFVQVGGLTTQPSKPMPEDLQKFFDEAGTEGVVLLSFGSLFDATSPELTKKLASALRKVRARAVVRFVESSTAENYFSDDVKLVSWFPQNDALGHPNTKVFVSHCGKNGFFESLYHAVPIVCAPLHADGYGTGRRVTEHGLGLSVDIFTATAEEIAETINTVLENKTFSQNMQRASELFRQRPETPAQRAASSVEHVMKYGSKHLRPVSSDLNFVQHNGYDVVTVLSLLALLVLFLITKILIYCMHLMVLFFKKRDTHFKKAHSE